MKKTFLILTVVTLLSCNLSKSEEPVYVGTWEHSANFSYSAFNKEEISTITLNRNKFMFVLKVSYSGDQDLISNEISDLDLPKGTTPYTSRLYGDLDVKDNIFNVMWTEYDFNGNGFIDLNNTKPQSITYSLEGDTLSLKFTEEATPILYIRQ